eukprot:5029974-Ditylum_brightwellii.AAC.2
MANVSTNHPMLGRVIEDDKISPDVFRSINNSVADMICNLNPHPSLKKRALDKADDDKSNKKAKTENSTNQVGKFGKTRKREED